MKFQAGTQYVCRGGRRAVVESVDGDMVYGRVYYEGGRPTGKPTMWFADGSHSAINRSPLDLVEAPEDEVLAEPYAVPIAGWVAELESSYPTSRFFTPVFAERRYLDRHLEKNDRTDLVIRVAYVGETGFVTEEHAA